MQELAYWVGLNMAPGIGPKRFARLREHFGTPEAVWGAGRAELLQVEGLSETLVDAFLAYRGKADPEREIERLWEKGVKALCLGSSDYPGSLAAIFDPPPVLYIKGEIRLADAVAIAIVGTRNPTTYGRAVADQLSQSLAREGLTVVSGLARGIDTISHRGALKVGGRTIAVLGCGLDIAYPPENASLMTEIAAAGAVVTPYPLGTRPEAGNFPARNRIISGLSLGTVVVEANEKSGALITADYALEQNKEVFAVPGSIISPASDGANRLIQQGAKLVGSVRDILDEFPFLFGGAGAAPVAAAAAGGASSAAANTAGSASIPAAPAVPLVAVPLVPPDLSPDELAVLERVTPEPVHIDEIIGALTISPAEVAATLMFLELKGHVQRQPGQLFCRPVTNRRIR